MLANSASISDISSALFGSDKSGMDAASAGSSSDSGSACSSATASSPASSASSVSGSVSSVLSSGSSTGSDSSFPAPISAFMLANSASISDASSALFGSDKSGIDAAPAGSSSNSDSASGSTSTDSPAGSSATASSQTGSASPFGSGTDSDSSFISGSMDFITGTDSVTGICTGTDCCTGAAITGACAISFWLCIIALLRRSSISFRSTVRSCRRIWRSLSSGSCIFCCRETISFWYSPKSFLISPISVII